MITHILRIAAAVTIILLSTLLPFFPGRYDPMAGPLSALARILGLAAGLLLVPVGALWAASRHSTWLAAKQRAIAVVALITATIVWCFVILGAFTLGGVTMGAAAVVAWGFALFKLIPRLKELQPTTSTATSAALFLLVTPILVVVLQLALVPRAVEFSRNRAIENSAPMIAGIERYFAQHGHYPSSLLSVWGDYDPKVIGIERYRYEPRGDAYNLVFEQVATNLAVREFVVYNPRNEHFITSHDADLLEFTGDDLTRRQGYFTARGTAHEHWKYFWFD